MSKSQTDNTELYLPRRFSTVTRDATLFQEGNALAVKYRVGRGSDILHSVGKLFDHFVGHKAVEQTRQNCRWVRYTNIIRVRRNEPRWTYIGEMSN